VSTVSGKRVLIAFGSRYGSTKEIAHRLAGFLDRRIAQSVMVGLSGELGLELDMGGGTIEGTGMGYGSSHIGARHESDHQSCDDGGLRGNMPKGAHSRSRLYLYHHFDIVGAIFFL
jgi:hypothetical protein